MLLPLLLAFLLGVAAAVSAEAALLLFLLRRFSRRRVAPAPTHASPLDSAQSLHLLTKKQGTVWVFEPEKVPKISTSGSPPTAPEVQKNRDIVEVSPVKKYAVIKDHSLIVSDVDGSSVTVELQNCTIVAVSASDLSSRKWAKRYPVRLESKNLLYNGSKICYLYLDTSWEKESWCKALRLASCIDKKKLKWYSELREEFCSYLASLNAEYPSFLKPSSVFVEGLESTDKSNRTDGASSRVRHLLKKLAKKTSKSESKTSVSTSTHGEKTSGEKSHFLQDMSLIDGLGKSSLGRKPKSNFAGDLPQSTTPTFPDTSEKFVDDEGTLCWNLLLSRLFFDAKRNIELNSAILARIQRTLLNMRTPSYIRGVICTGVDLGNLAPYIHKLRVLPMDLNETWAVEVDIEYSRGILLNFETRIEVGELRLQEDTINTSLEPGSSEELKSDLLEGIEQYENQLKSSTHSDNMMENKDEEDKEDFLKQSNSWASRWKAMKKSLANQVSQVPLSLAVRVASLRGTLRLHMKPPPSDHIWYGFTSMPEIEWNLESSIGDRKITNARIALLIGNRIKAAMRESVVLPNCESIYIPFMLAEKDDWVPRAAAPFIWFNQEVFDKSGSTSSSSLNGEAKLKPVDINANEVAPADLKGNKVAPADYKENKVDPADTKRNKLAAAAAKFDNREIVRKETLVPKQNQHLPSVVSLPEDLFTQDPSYVSSCTSGMEVMGKTVSKSEETEDSCINGRVESPRASTSRALVTREEQPTVPSEDDLKPRTGSRRARMLDIGKKMGEKLEEKRRHIEEKIEKMRENSKN